MHGPSYPSPSMTQVDSFEREVVEHKLFEGLLVEVGEMGGFPW